MLTIIHSCQQFDLKDANTSNSLLGSCLMMFSPGVCAGENDYFREETFSERNFRDFREFWASSRKLSLSLLIVSTTVNMRYHFQPVISPELSIFRNSPYYRWKEHKMLKEIGWFRAPSPLSRSSHMREKKSGQIKAVYCM